MTDILTSDARASGTFAIGGDLVVNRIGYGAMRIAGPGVWRAPRDRAAALATLRRLPELGVNFIDTADSYGPDVSEQLIYEALHPYERLVVATKAGLKRPGPDQWAPHGDPDYLITRRIAAASCSASIRSTCGSCIASIPRYRRASSSMRSRGCWPRA